MNKIKSTRLKIVLGLFCALLVIFILFIFLVLGSFIYDEYEDSKFYNISIPLEKNHLKKPAIQFSKQQFDSLNSVENETEKVVLVGNGYSGYDFFYWHKSDQKGIIFLRAYEITQEIELMKELLSERTKKKINNIDNKFQRYTAHSVIYEGTFEKYYPVRFELWFQSDDGKVMKKLSEVEYVIDGWDR